MIITWNSRGSPNIGSFQNKTELVLPTDNRKFDLLAGCLIQLWSKIYNHRLYSLKEKQAIGKSATQDWRIAFENLGQLAKRICPRIVMQPSYKYQIYLLMLCYIYIYTYIHIYIYTYICRYILYITSTLMDIEIVRWIDGYMIDR